MLPETTNPAACADRRHLLEFLEGFLDRTVAVGAIVRLRHRQHEADGVDSILEGERALQAAHVRGHRPVADAWNDIDPAHDRFGVGKLRNCLRVHEGGDLDLRHAGARQSVDEPDLQLGWYPLLLGLKAVARPDLHDVDFAGQLHFRSPGSR